MRQLSLIGIDISESSIKVLQLDGDGNIVAFGTKALAEGIVHDGLILDTEAFSVTLGEVLKNTKPVALSSSNALLRAVVCLPESKLFTYYAMLPLEVKKSDIEAYIFEDAKKIIPFDLAEMYSDYHSVEKDGVCHVTFVGAPKKNVDSYVSALTKANVKPALIGSELFSLGYALLPKTEFAHDYMIIDMGAHTANIGIFSMDAIANISVTVQIGGAQITQAIVEALGISPQVAEERKHTEGLIDNGTGTVAPIVQRSVDELVEHINKTRSYFETKSGRKVGEILLAGGSALLPGLADYLTKTLGVTTKVAQPFAHIHNKDVLDKNIPEIFFGNVVGLALLSKDQQISKINLLTQYRYSNDQVDKERLSLAEIRSLGDMQYVLYSFLKSVLSGFKRIATVLSIHSKLNMPLVATGFFLLCTLIFLGWVVITYM